MPPMASSGTRRAAPQPLSLIPSRHERIKTLETCLPVCRGLSDWRRGATGSHVVWGHRDWTWWFCRKHQTRWH